MSPAKKTVTKKDSKAKPKSPAVRRFSKADEKESASPLTDVRVKKSTSALPFDPKLACRHISTQDKKLAKVIEAVGDCWLEVHHMNSCYESLLESIVYQQLTGKAAATIMGRVKGIYGDRFPKPLEILETDDEKLRAAGLSRAKVAAIKDLSAKTQSGLVPDIEHLEKMSDEEIISLLTQVRGIGTWSVQMLLIFRMGRPDVLPVTDYGVRKGFARVYKLADLPKPLEMIKKAEKWSPYRSIASWYLWRVLELSD
ncbi:MAG: DNA-3-methyladenine glycosylase [Candidatus Obscuribacterales bacterium]|jgi:3-methyladenine DNA glycosylase/8-oxoguanine DNA glycosylase|nr:DNA-3-methyladenine glycosylase [Candidatus Obscuribacterales bacterium]